MNYIRKTVGANLASPQLSWKGHLVMQMMKRKNDYLERCAVNHCKISEGEKILEIGFGHGLGLHYAANTGKASKVYGIDISQLALQYAEELLYAEIASSKVVLFESSVHNIPLNSSTIDTAFSVNSFYFWPHIPQACTELLRVIKPGGRLLTVQNIDSILKRRRSGGFNQANVDFLAYMQTLEDVGFLDVHITYLTDEVTHKPYQCISATAHHT